MTRMRNVKSLLFNVLIGIFREVEEHEHELLETGYGKLLIWLDRNYYKSLYEFVNLHLNVDTFKILASFL